MAGTEMTRDLATFMVVEGIGTALGQDVFLERRPPTPDRCLTLVDTGGFPPIRGVPDLRRTVQVMVRSKGTQAAKGLAWDCHGLFFPDGQGRHIRVGGKSYLTLPTASALPSPLGEDDDGRMLFVMNLVVTTTPDQ